MQLAGWGFRFTAFWFLLEAFGVGGSVKNVLLVLGVNAVSALVPFTPQGAGVQQALLAKVFAGTAAGATVAAYSVGQQIAIGAFTFGIGFAGHAVHLPGAQLQGGHPAREARTGQAEQKASALEPGPGEPAYRCAEALARLAHEDDRLGEQHAASPRGPPAACCSALPWRLRRLMPATVMSTASLIALSAQATFCAPCICSAISPSRLRSSSGSPNRPPKGSSELIASLS